MTNYEQKMADVAELGDIRREATQQQYLENSDIISGWEWVAPKSPRTCMACLFTDGMQFSLDIPFNDVKRCANRYCRCTLIAVIIGVERPQRTLGAEWFASLSADEKRMMATTQE